MRGVEDRLVSSRLVLGKTSGWGGQVPKMRRLVTRVSLKRKM